MKRSARVLFSFVMLLALAATASAQSRTLIAEIPFDFHMGDTAMASGKYMVRMVGDSVLQLKSAEGPDGAFKIAQPDNSPVEQTKNVLVFSRYGDQYFLSKVIWAYTGVARNLPKTGTEIELAKSLSSQRTILAARR